MFLGVLVLAYEGEVSRGELKMQSRWVVRVRHPRDTCKGDQHHPISNHTTPQLGRAKGKKIFNIPLALHLVNSTASQSLGTHPERTSFSRS